MKIKILNKNSTHPNVDSDGYFYVDDGANRTEVKNETLDSGSIILNNLSTPIDIEPYDIIEIINYNQPAFYMCVDTYTETLVCVSPKVYRYEISLFSETKQLENTILPNRKITKVWNKTRTVYDYINEYMTLYCPKVKIAKEAYVVDSFDTIEDEGTLEEAEDDKYYLVAAVSSPVTSDFLPDEELNIEASAEIGYDGEYQTVTDNNCKIIINEIRGNKWYLEFRIYLGQHTALDYGQLDGYTVNHRSLIYDYMFRWKTDKNIAKFNMQCPEMQWNTPTLREVLNDLMMVADCIPTIVNGTLDFMDLTTINNKDWTNDTTHLNYVTKSKSSEDYVSELQVKLENVTNQTEQANNVVTKAEWINFSPEGNEVALKNDNMVLKTQYPIYNLKSLTIFFVGDKDSDEVWTAQDLVELGVVCEYQEWITKKVLYNEQQPSTVQEMAESQNWSVYYTRNTNEIRNWSHKNKFWWQDFFLYNVLAAKVSLYKNNDGGNFSQWYGILFKVEYETLEGCLFRASKAEYPEHERVIIDNQTNSMVDSYNQGFLEYQKANRLGNEQLQINARFLSSEIANIMKIGDTYDDCVIYQCQYQYFKNHIEVNALATKNYILQNYFTGVKSKIRSWAIEDASKACNRHELQKFYCELSYDEHYDVDLDNFDNYDNITSYFCSPLDNYDAAPIKYLFVRTTANPGTGNEWYPSSGYYNLDLISRIVGNSMIFTYGFLDNYWAGQALDTDIIEYEDFVDYASGKIDEQELIQGQGFPLKMLAYTDSNGEAITFTSRFSEGIICSPIYGDMVDGEVINHNLQYTELEKNNRFLYNVWQKPQVQKESIEDERFMTSSKYYKDSQETINVSTQFEFCSDTRDISISKNFIQRQQAISIYGNSVSTLQISAYTKSAYNFRKPNELPDATPVEDFPMIISPFIEESEDGFSATIKLVFLGYSETTVENAVEIASNLAEDYCFYIHNGTQVIMSFNNVPISDKNIGAYRRPGETPAYFPQITLYMNLLKSRNKNIYDEDNRYLIVGQI